MPEPWAFELHPGILPGPAPLFHLALTLPVVWTSTLQIASENHLPQLKQPGRGGRKWAGCAGNVLANAGNAF